MNPHPLLRLSALRKLEATAQAALPPGTLMRRAGTAAARVAMDLGSDRPGPVWVLAGPGNNGGDAVVTAQVLRAAGMQVELALLAPPTAFHGDAAAAWAAASAAGAAGAAGAGAWRADLVGIEAASMVIDGLFGIGLSRALPAQARDWVGRVNALACPVLALDIPSGLMADTGSVPGDCAVRATVTLTFLADKPGLHTRDGPDHAGRVLVESLGVGADAPLRGSTTAPSAESPSAEQGMLIQPRSFTTSLRPRARNSHKGVFGNLAVIGGNTGMVGAALLAARTALHAGAGRVYVQLLAAGAPAWDPVQPELMLRFAPADLGLDAAVLGPGMGVDAPARAVLDAALSASHALVLDADALNLVAAQPELADRLAARAGRGAATLLTPHPLEAARLLGVGVAEVQADRIAAACTLARRCAAHVILKGAGSIVALPPENGTGGAWFINPTGNPGLATAGTGDVLAGLIGALLAQGWSPTDAALGGTWLHGHAADRWCATASGPIGMVATDLIGPIRAELNDLVNRRSAL